MNRNKLKLTINLLCPAAGKNDVKCFLKAITLTESTIFIARRIKSRRKPSSLYDNINTTTVKLNNEGKKLAIALYEYLKEIENIEYLFFTP